MAGYNLACELLGKPMADLDTKTVTGALATYISTPNENFQPMNANFGIVSGLNERIRKKQERYAKIAERALAEIKKVSV